MSLAEELAALLRQVREQEKKIRCLKKENEFLEEAQRQTGKPGSWRTF